MNEILFMISASCIWHISTNSWHKEFHCMIRFRDMIAKLHEKEPGFSHFGRSMGTKQIDWSFTTIPVSEKLIK